MTFKTLTLVIAGLCCIQSLSAQNKAKGDVASLINSRQFIFVPGSVTPQGGRFRFLNGDFDLKIKNDSMQSYLPFFGTSDVAPLNPDDAGINFSSTNFDYSHIQGKKGKFTVNILVNVPQNGYKFVMTIYDNYSADLLVTSNFRSPISFRGEIRALKQ